MESIIYFATVMAVVVELVVVVEVSLVLERGGSNGSFGTVIMDSINCVPVMIAVVAITYFPSPANDQGEMWRLVRSEEATV